MTIDTVRLSVVSKLKKFDWVESELITVDKTNNREFRKYITKGLEGEKVVPRLTYQVGDEELNRLMVEVSLPKLLLQENFTVLSDSQIIESMDKLQDWVSNKIGQSFGSWAAWHVSRLDACYAWKVGDDMKDYIGSLVNLPVHGYTRSPYIRGDQITEGFTWHCKSRKVNVYDKGLECGDLAAQGLLRLECQERTNDAVKTLVSREKGDNLAGELINGDVARKDINRWLKRSGLGSDMKTSVNVVDLLKEEFGYEAASRIYFIEGFKRFGSAMVSKDWCSKETYYKRHRELSKKGYLLNAKEKSLPGLKISKTKNLKKGDNP